VQHF